MPQGPALALGAQRVDAREVDVVGERQERRRAARPRASIRSWPSRASVAQPSAREGAGRQAGLLPRGAVAGQGLRLARRPRRHRRARRRSTSLTWPGIGARRGSRASSNGTVTRSDRTSVQAAKPVPQMSPTWGLRPARWSRTIRCPIGCRARVERTVVHGDRIGRRGLAAATCPAPGPTLDSRHIGGPLGHIFTRRTSCAR